MHWLAEHYGVSRPSNGAVIKYKRTTHFLSNPFVRDIILMWSKEPAFKVSFFLLS